MHVAVLLLVLIWMCLYIGVCVLYLCLLSHRRDTINNMHITIIDDQRDLGTMA